MHGNEGYAPAGVALDQHELRNAAWRAGRVLAASTSGYRPTILKLF